MEKTFEYRPQGTCSVKMRLVMDGDIIRDFSVVGGCPGNLQGIRALIIGMKAEEVEKKLSGIRCGFKDTSCPDQLSKALHAYLEEEKKA